MSATRSALTNEDVVRLMNAWRRLAAFMALADRPDVPSNVRALICEFVEPAIRDLNAVADQVPASQLADTNHSPAAWFPNLQEGRWRPSPRLRDDPASD